MTGVHLNDAVQVRLTPFGEAVLAQHHDRMRERVGSSAHIYRPGPDGRYRMPLWDLMRLFGPTCGLTRPPPFEGEILIGTPSDPPAAPVTP